MSHASKPIIDQKVVRNRRVKEIPRNLRVNDASSKSKKRGRTPIVDDSDDDDDVSEVARPTSQKRRRKQLSDEEEVYEVARPTPKKRGRSKLGDEDEETEVVVVTPKSKKKGSEKQNNNYGFDVHDDTEKSLVREVWTTLTQNIPEEYKVISFSDFLTILVHSSVDIRLLLPKLHPSSSAAAAAASSSSSILTYGQWNDISLFSACHEVNEKISTTIKDINEYLDAIREELLKMGQDRLDKSNISMLLQVRGHAYLTDSDRRKAIDYETLIRVVEEEKSALDQVLNMKMKYAKLEIIKKGHPFYDGISSSTGNNEWSTKLQGSQYEEYIVRKLSDLILNKRIIDGKEYVIMYHGSPIRHMQSFYDGGIKFIGGGFLGNGFYMSASPNEAKTYACRNGLGVSKRGIVLEIALSSADLFDVYGNNSYPPADAICIRDQGRPNQFVFRESELFRLNCRVLKIYQLEPGFKYADNTVDVGRYSTCH